MCQENERLNKSSGKISFIHSDLFKSFPKKLQNKFNVIIFNPPYLPAIDKDTNHFSNDKDYSWKGGEKGYEILINFFSEVLMFLASGSNAIKIIYYITSSRVKKDKITEKLNNLGFQTQELVKTHVFFEDIILNRAIRIST